MQKYAHLVVLVHKNAADGEIRSGKGAIVAVIGLVHSRMKPAELLPLGPGSGGFRGKVRLVGLTRKTFANVCKARSRLYRNQIFARKYTFDSIFQDLQDLHSSAPLRSQNFRKKSV